MSDKKGMNLTIELKTEVLELLKYFKNGLDQHTKKEEEKPTSDRLDNAIKQLEEVKIVYYKNITINHFISTLFNRDLTKTAYSKTCRTKLIHVLEVYNHKFLSNKGLMFEVYFKDLEDISHYRLGKRTENLYMNHLDYIGYNN